MATIQRAKLTREDLGLYDGVNRTISRVDATGGTVTALAVDDVVDVLQVYGEGDTRTVATIEDALNAIGTSNNRMLLFSTGTWVIDSNVTIPANLASRVAAGRVFAISTGVTLTFSGPVHVEFSTSTGTGWYTLAGTGVISCTLGAGGFPGW